MTTQQNINQLPKDRQDFIRQAIASLMESMPATFPRNKVHDVTGGMITGTHMANLASLGDTPLYGQPGKKIVYEKNTFLKWFEGYLIKQELMRQRQRERRLNRYVRQEVAI